MQSLYTRKNFGELTFLQNISKSFELFCVSYCDLKNLYNFASHFGINASSNLTQCMTSVIISL